MRLWFAICMALTGAMAQADSAAFTIRNEVVAEDVDGFTASITSGPRVPRIQNAGFEPIELRHRLMVQADAPDRILASEGEMSSYGQLRSGVWDGAEVDIFRVVNGEMRLVRQDRVAQGGHQVHTWRNLTGPQMVPAETTSFQMPWLNISRPDAPFYFTVRAVDRNGRLSPEAAPVAVQSPSEFKQPQAQNRLVPSPQIDTGRSSRLDAPQNLRVRTTFDGMAVVEWSPSGRRTVGYLVYMSDTPPETHTETAHLRLEGEGPPLKRYDMAILRKTLYRSNRADLIRNRVFNLFQPTAMFRIGPVLTLSDDVPAGLWELRPHGADTPVPDAGETYLSLRFDNTPQAVVQGYGHSGTAQDFHDVLVPGARYTVDVWMRGQSTEPVLFRPTGAYASANNGPPIDPRTLVLTPQWQRHSFEFEIPYLNTTASYGDFGLVFQGTGTADIDNFRIYRSDSGGFMQWSEKDLFRLRSSGMTALRTHGLIKTGQRTYSMAQATNAAGAISGTHQGETILQALRLSQSVGMVPWLQIEPHMSREEWLGFAEYLAAPFDPVKDTPQSKPWAAKRHGQGHPAPWVDVFDKVYFEIGNETWNRIFHPWIFDAMRDEATNEGVPAGRVYGLYQEYVLSILRESPHWPALEPKLVPVLGGWASLPFGQQAASASPNSDFMTIAAYNGGWDEGEGPVQDELFSYGSILTHAVQTTAVRMAQHMAELDTVSADHGRRIHFGSYEAGPGYALNGLNGARVGPQEKLEQERVMKSNAAGTATLDTFLLSARDGMRLQNYFTYGPGPLWRSHAEHYQGGQLYPSWAWLTVFNRFGTGDFLAVDTETTPVRDLAPLVRREKMEDAPLVGVYATQKEDRVAVFVVSRRVPGFPDPGNDGRTDITITLPFTTAKRVTRHSMTGGWRASNAVEPEAGIVSRPWRLPAPGAPLVLEDFPPGEAMAFIFEGVAPAR